LANDAAHPSRDWLASTPKSLVAWWAPQTILLVGLLLPTPVRAAVWIMALTWMGLACIFNATRCGRTHCRYTGPFYLAMTVPALVLGLGFISASLLGWLILAFVVWLGSKILWWGTERMWGRFS